MIEIENLKKEYKKVILYEKTNITFRTNKIAFILGKNGSGKTTLIKCLFKMENYDGTVLFDGVSVDKVRDKCLVIWDDTPFYGDISGLNNLYIFAKNKKSKNDIINIAQQYLELSTLKSKVSQYSYGQKKKLALALVDILEPKYLIMDEISNGLDYETMCFLKGKIKEWSNCRDILLTGHQFDFYNELIDDVYIIKDSSISLYKENIEKGCKLEEVYDEKLLDRRY